MNRLYNTVLDRLTPLVTHALEISIVACLAVMSILVFGNVVLRYAFNSGIVLSEELSRLLFVWLVFLGAILASREHAHIGVDLLIKRLPAAGKRLCIALTALIMLGICVMLIWGSALQMRINFTNALPVSGLPYASLYAAGVVGGAGLLISILYNVLVALTRPQSNDELILISNSEDESLVEDAKISHVEDSKKDRS